MSQIKITLLSFFVFASISCEKECKYKDQVCNTSSRHLGNKTNDTIFYSIGSNFFEDTLTPGEVRILKGSKVNVTYDKKSCEKKRTAFSTYYLNASTGGWYFNVEHCESIKNLKYDNNVNGHISLYDESAD